MRTHLQRFYNAIRAKNRRYVRQHFRRPPPAKAAHCGGAQILKDLADVPFSEVSKIILVQDYLSTQGGARGPRTNLQIKASDLFYKAVCKLRKALFRGTSTPSVGLDDVAVMGKSIGQRGHDVGGAIPALARQSSEHHAVEAQQR